MFADVATLKRYEQYEIERLFAATAIQYPIYTVKMAGWLSPSIVLSPAVRKFWEVLLRGVTTNMTDTEAGCVVTQAIIDSGVDKELGTEYQTTTMYDMMPQILADEVSRRNYVSSVGSKIGDLLIAVRNSDEAEIKRIVSEMNTATPVGTDNSLSVYDLHSRFMAAIVQGNRSIATGVSNLDRYSGGLERQTETIIAGRPSMGKSGLMWFMARAMASTGMKVVFYSLEMSATALWARAACPQAGVLWRDVRSGNVTEAQNELLARKSLELMEKYGPSLRVIETGQTTESIWQDCATVSPDVVFVDHLRRVKDRGDNENKRQGLISERLSDMAKWLNCAVVIAAQLNRGVEDRSEKLPVLSDLRDCGEIEENADVVLMLYRPDYYDPPLIPTHRHYIEVWVRKNRDGVQNSLVKMIYDTGLQSFEPYEDHRPV